MIAEEGGREARSILGIGGPTRLHILRYAANAALKTTALHLDPPPSPFFVSADSKGVRNDDFVSADSKEVRAIDSDLPWVVGMSLSET